MKTTIDATIKKNSDPTRRRAPIPGRAILLAIACQAACPKCRQDHVSASNLTVCAWKLIATPGLPIARWYPLASNSWRQLWEFAALK